MIKRNKAFTLEEVKPLCPDWVTYQKINISAPNGEVLPQAGKGCHQYKFVMTDGKGEQSMKRKNILASICHSELVSESDNSNNFTRVRSRNKFGITKNIKAAFTLAEILITLLIIGVVTALTLPTLMQNISDRKNSTKVAVFNSKFIQGLNLTKNAGEMGTQYSSTYDFLKNGLSNHLKMAAICDSDHLKDCLGYDEIKYENKSGKEKTVKVSSLKTADKLNIKEKGFEDTAAFIMGDGTPVLLSYNLNCMDDGGVDKTISSCVAGLFDINGSRKPNMFLNKISNGKSEAHDIRSFNGARPGNSCFGQIGDLCISSSATGGSESAYDDMYNVIKAIDESYTRPTFNNNTKNDNWKLANDYCEKVTGGSLPSSEQLAQIATELYGTKITSEQYKSGISMINRNSVFASLGIMDNPSSWFAIWSSQRNEKSNEGDVYYRDYYSGYTRWYNNVTHANNDRRVVCIED